MMSSSTWMVPVMSNTVCHEVLADFGTGVLSTFCGEVPSYRQQLFVLKLEKWKSPALAWWLLLLLSLLEKQCSNCVVFVLSQLTSPKFVWFPVSCDNESPGDTTSKQKLHRMGEVWKMIKNCYVDPSQRVLVERVCKTWWREKRRHWHGKFVDSVWNKIVKRINCKLWQ